MSRPTTKKLYYFNGSGVDQDERLTMREVKKHKEYRKLLTFLLKNKR